MANQGKSAESKAHIYMNGRRVYGFRADGMPIFDEDLQFFVPRPTQLALSINWANRCIGAEGWPK